MRSYLINLLIALDQLANAILRGDPDETLSSRAHRMRAKGQPVWGWTASVIDALFWFDKDHCRTSWERWRDIHRWAEWGEKQV